MIDTLTLVKIVGHPTREDCTTTARNVGEDFLSQYLNAKNINYGGYLIEQGKLAPFWRLGDVPTKLVSELYKLTQYGYIGKIERKHFSY